MAFLRLAVWVVGQGFQNGRKRKWGTRGAPERRLGGHCPDVMNGRKKQPVYNPCHGGEQLILTQQGRAGDTWRPGIRRICYCSKCWKWIQRSTTHQVWGWQGSLLLLQGEQGPLRSALLEMFACFPAVHFWFRADHPAQSAQSLMVTLAREPRAVYRSSLSARTQQCKPGSLAIFHTATVTGSQNTWVIYSVLAAQSQAWCFPNNVKTQISPYRTQSKIGKILLKQW